MKFVVSITFRLNGCATENEVAARRILDVYSKWTPPASTTFHQFVARVDGGGGFSVVDTDNPADLMEITSKFAPFADCEIYPVVDIADGVPVLQEAAEFRKFLWWPGSQSPPAIRRGNAHTVGPARGGPHRPGHRPQLNSCRRNTQRRGM